MAAFVGIVFGDIALVPGPMLNPKTIRVVAEWYRPTISRRSYIHRSFERQCELG